MEYEITTLSDIFEKVPTDKIEKCLTELGVAMVQAKSMNDLLCIAAEDVTGMKLEKAVEWPETSTWIDDDAGEIDLSFGDKDGDYISLKTKVGA